MPISSGIPAPEFELLDDTNTLRKLSDFRGRNVILYFYPKDDTPGCTKEACNFRDDYLYWRIATGKEGTSMVAWKGVLTDDQIWQAVAFVRTLK